MRARVKSGGFTILETMITMTISAGMLVTVILLFSGKQREVQFSQGIRAIESTIMDYVNDTATGYFPQDNTSTCTPGPSGPDVISTGTNEQGTNQGCVFLGRALHFTEDSIKVYPIVGNSAEARSASAGAGFPAAIPKVVEIFDEEYSYPYGMELRSIYWDNNSTDRVTDGALIVFASSPNGTGQSTSGGSNPGIQRISAYSSGVAGNPIGFGATTSSINSAMQNPSISWPAGGYVVLCFEDSPVGSVGRKHAGIAVSGGTRELSASIQLEGMGYQCP